MDISIGEIVTDHSFAFLKKKEVVSISSLGKQQTENMYHDYEAWCLENNILPDGKHCFYQKLLSLGIIKASLFNDLFMSSFLSPDEA